MGDINPFLTVLGYLFTRPVVQKRIFSSYQYMQIIQITMDVQNKPLYANIPNYTDHVVNTQPIYSDSIFLSQGMVVVECF